MSFTTERSRSRRTLAVAATVVLVVSAAAAGASLVTVGTASAASAQVSNCTTIDEPGTYELTGDARTGDGACVTITASDVVFDGDGHTVSGFHGVLVDDPTGVENVTVQNVTVGADWYGTAVTFENVTDGVVVNATLASGKYGSLSVANSEDFTLRDSLVGNRFDISADNVTVVDNHVENFMYGSDLQGNGAVVRNNTLEGADAGIQGQYFFALEVEGSDNRIVNNTIPPSESGIRGASVEGTNATVRNNTAVSASAGSGPSVYYTGFSVSGRNHTVVGNIVAEFGGPGINLNGSDHVVHDNVLVDNDVGIRVTTRDSLIYDNRLHGGDAAFVPYVYPDYEYGYKSNTWNVSPRAQTNVMGGNTTGGNYYIDTDGIGFSEACADEDEDGICDHPNAVAYNNTDYLPLADEGNMSTAYFEVADITASGRLDADGKTTVTANVTNVGTRSDTQAIGLKVTGDEHDVYDDPARFETVASRTVTLEAGETKTVTFDLSFDRTGTDERVVVDSLDSFLSRTVTPFLADDGNGTDSNVTTYQVDFVEGRPIENLSADRLYAQEDRLMRFAFGNTSAGITKRDTAWPSSEIRQCVDYGHIRERADGTAAVTFTVPIYCEDVTLTLAVYSTPGMAFFPETADQQVLLNATTDTYGPGEHTITVNLPDGSDD